LELSLDDGRMESYPALAAGNTVVVKPSSLTPLTTLEFARIIEKAGVPKGAFNVITGPGAEAGEALVTDPRVDVVGFTGDTVTGRRIMELASRTVKRYKKDVYKRRMGRSREWHNVRCF
jgi:acyl-CoA reductase-like NAD-dependent aldehyde dehydrogenase